MSFKRILVISWQFPPYKSSSAFNLFKRVKDTGYTYDVIQIAKKGQPSNEGMFEFAQSKFYRYEISMPSEESRSLENRAFFSAAVIRLYEKLKEQNHYTIVLSHSHETASHIAAQALTKKYPNLLWIASFGDPIAANPYNDSYKFALIKEDSATEREIFNQADRIVVTNDYQKTLMLSSVEQKNIENKFYILPHCFDATMYSKKNVKNSVFRFMHVGMLYKYKRTSLPFIKAAGFLLEHFPQYKSAFTLEFYGATDQYIDEAESGYLKGVVKYKGIVNYLDSLKLMTTADCLLLRDADFSDQGLNDTPFFPGKLADYLGAEKPVIAVTMETGFVPDMMHDLDMPSLTEENIKGIAHAMKEAIDGHLSLNQNTKNYYSTQAGTERARKLFEFSPEKLTVIVAGHDLKFAKFIIESLEADNRFNVLIDKWNNHNNHDEEASKAMLAKADVIFCEWGLGNAVWYSHNKKPGQKLVVRIHRQEFDSRHPEKFKHDAIDTYIMVSPQWFEKFIAEFNFERRKCKMVYNLVDTDCLNKPKVEDARFHLGMIGDVPKMKRLDKAIDIFAELYKKDQRYQLFIKGKRPQDYPWMHTKARKADMDYYNEQYQRIKDNDWVDNVVFEGFGPIDEWLQKIGWILSVSDFESFHLAAAEGMASGAIPVIYSWAGAETIYPEDLIFHNISAVTSFIFSPDSFQDRKKHANRFCKKLNCESIINLLY